MADRSGRLQLPGTVPRAREGNPSEQPVEALQLRAGTGTYIYARRRVAESRLIDDLEAGVWIQSDQRGLQLFGRIVFPDAIDPDTGRRATLLVAGETYESVGQWQRLRLRDVPSKVERQVRVLRARLRQRVDTRTAFLDSVVVNVYGGPGSTEVRFGQVELAGNIPPDTPREADVMPAGYERTPAAGSTPPRSRSGRLIVDGRPFFPRVIEYRGEALSLLHGLGFNTVHLQQPPTQQQREEAQRLGLWIIAPPPTEDLPAAVDDERILGWFCGADLSFDKVPAGYLDRLRRRDPHRRPLIASVQRNQWRASRELDILLRRRDPLGSSFELSHFGPWLDQMTQLARPGTPFWSCVQTELSAEVAQQVGVLGNVNAPLPRQLQVEQIRQLALGAVAAGARGLWFPSTTPLDGSDPESQLRRLILELINYELALIEPWGMGGQRLGEVPCDNAELRVVALATERSRLLIPTYIQPNAQFACCPTSGGNAMVIAGVSDSTDVFQISHVGLMPLKKKRISGGLRIELEPELADSLLLLTEDPLVVSHINRTVAKSKRRVVELEQELADRLLADFETSASRQLLATPERVETWETARLSLQTSRDLARANDASSAFRFAHQANRQLNKLQADVWRGMTADWNCPLSHPAGATFALSAAAHLVPPATPDDGDWSVNLLRGGECEDLNLMIDAGWRQHRTSPSDIRTYISLSPHEPHSGRSCLRILAAATTPDADESVVEFAPVWINSSPITVHPGQRVKITGWIRIKDPIHGSLDGCVIGDSISESALALRFRRTHGWQRFQMVRAVTRHDHLTIMITLHGLGEVWIDDLQVAVDAGPANQVSHNGLVPAAR